MKIFIFIVHILTMAALIYTSMQWMAWGLVESIAGLFKHDLLSLGLASLVCALLSGVAFFITMIYIKDCRFLRQLNFAIWKKRELVMDCCAAGVFFIDMAVLFIVIGFKMPDGNLFTIMAIWAAGLLLNVISAVLTKRM